MFRVDYLVKDNSTTVGAILTNLITQEVIRVQKSDFYKLENCNFYNAVYKHDMNGGYLAGKSGGGNLETITVAELVARDSQKAIVSSAPSWTHTFMCMDTVVARLAVGTGGIAAVEFVNPAYLPVGLKQDADSITRWINRRKIPASRAHLKRMEWVIGSIDNAVFRSLGLSLSDSYWFKPIASGKTWADVNFFTNDFTDDVGDYLMTEAMGGVDVNSPSVNTEGMVPKKWVIVANQRRLVKSGGRDFWQYNEVAASRIGKALGLPVLPYALYEKNSCCACPCMVRPGQNLVTADDILREKLGAHSSTESGWYDNDPSFYEVLCGEFGREYIDGIILFDYVIRNRDRHTRNIARIQNAKTRQYIKNASIFDNGSSLMESYDPLDRDFHRNIGKKIRDASRPFYSPHDIQIRLIDKTPFIPKLRECAKSGEIGSIIRDTYKSSRIDSSVINALATYIDGLVVNLAK